MSWVTALNAVIFTVIILLYLVYLLIFHCFRQHHIRLSRRKKPYRFCNILDLEIISYIAIISAIISLITILLFYAAIRITISSCTVFYCLRFLAFVINKASIYLFIVFRSIFSNYKPKQMTIWFKIGLFLISTYIFYLIYLQILVFSNPPYFDALNGFCFSFWPLPVFVWQILSDVVIGIYCLCVFVIPLKKIIIESKNKNNNDEELEYMVTKIIIYSSITIVSSILVYPLTQITKGLYLYVYGLDQVINIHCVVMQFKNINSLRIKSIFTQKLCKCLQYECCICLCVKPPITTIPTLSHKKSKTFSGNIPRNNMEIQKINDPLTVHSNTECAV